MNARKIAGTIAKLTLYAAFAAVIIGIALLGFICTFR